MEKDPLTISRHLATGLPVHHITVLDAALAQVPEAHRYGAPILVRADTAGCTKAFLAHLRGLTGGSVTLPIAVEPAVIAHRANGTAPAPDAA